MSRLLSKKVKSFFVLSLLAGLLALVPASPALADLDPPRFGQDSPDVGGAEEEDDYFGSGGLVSGDFNNDGFDDLAVGTSFEEIGNIC